MKSFPYTMFALNVETGRKVESISKYVAETRTAALEAVNEWNRLAGITGGGIIYRYTLITDEAYRFTQRVWNGETVLVLDKGKET